MAHQGFDQLQVALTDARREVVVGGNYAHYKHPDKPYRVLDLVITEIDDDVAVLYAAHDAPDVHFVRLLASWLELVEVDGRAVPRFRLVRP